MEQSTFSPPIDRSRDVVRICSVKFDVDRTVIAMSGGGDSTVAADVFARIGPEFGLEPDAVVHVNTGASVPQSRLVAKTVAEMNGLEFIEQEYRNEQDSLASRVLEHGWPGGYGGSPATGGHGLEWANRKDKPMDEVYVNVDGFQVWVSGARKAESANRSANLPGTGVEQDKPRRAWCAVIGGWTDAEKRRYIEDRGLPVSESYLALGYSGECTACAFDDAGLLTDVDLLSPELGYAIRTLAVWLYQRVRRGDVDLAPKRLCWGWEPGDEPDPEPSDRQAMVGCDTETCEERDRPEWVLDLPDEQIVSRSDVERYWETGDLPSRFPVGPERLTP